MRTGIRFALLAGAVALLTTAVPTAYVLTGPKWATRTVNFYINPSNADMSDADAEAAIQGGAAAWGSQSNADFRFYYVGRTSGTTLTNNGRNEVFFRNTSNGYVIAETYWWGDAYGHIIDADIVFYDGGMQFFGSNTPCSGSGIYVENTAVHEFGHALGLGHSADPNATMYGSSLWCSTTGMTLENDDKAGIEALYPASGQNTAPAITITSPANGLSILQGVATTFSGSATDQQDGNLSSRITWSSNLIGQLGVGSSLVSLLPAGTHVVTARVTDNGGYSATSTVTVSVGAAPANASPDGTRLPPASQIIDNQGTVWTLLGQTILRNGIPSGGMGTTLTWCGGVIRTFGLDGQWWRWNGGWSPIGATDPCSPTAPPPGSTTSPDGTRLPPATQIVDAAGATWTMSGLAILRNGQDTGGLGSTVTWCGGVIRTFGTDSQWWAWSGGWSPIGTTDPCTGTSTGPPPPPPPSPTPTPTTFTLSTNGYRVTGGPRVDLSWSGATTANVDVYRNNALITTTANDGTHLDALNKKSSGTFTYKVCNAGTSTCSNTSSVVF